MFGQRESIPPGVKWNRHDTLTLAGILLAILAVGLAGRSDLIIDSLEKHRISLPVAWAVATSVIAIGYVIQLRLRSLPITKRVKISVLIAPLLGAAIGFVDMYLRS